MAFEKNLKVIVGWLIISNSWLTVQLVLIRTWLYRMARINCMVLKIIKKSQILKRPKDCIGQTWLCIWSSWYGRYGAVFNIAEKHDIFLRCICLPSLLNYWNLKKLKFETANNRLGRIILLRWVWNPLKVLTAKNVFEFPTIEFSSLKGWY